MREDLRMRLLVIEDNKDLCDSICFHLKNEGYTTDTCYTGETALFYALQNTYDIIILDRMLPVMDGLTILKEIRKHSINVPVILVTAMSDINDRIDGLDAGADDYLVKPFAVNELLARVRALARRPSTIMVSNTLTLANLTLDTTTKCISTPYKSMNLAKRESDLLECFMRNSNRILPRELLLSRVWGPDHFVEDGNLDNYICFLRRHLKNIGAKLTLKTIHTVGYQLIEQTGA